MKDLVVIGSYLQAWDKTRMRMIRTKSYYGWYLAVTLAVTETISWGVIYYAFSVFLTPMEHDLGWSRAELTAGFSLMWLMAGVMAFPVGVWIDKYGPRLLMTIGSIGASLLVIAWSQVTTQPMFYLIWAGLGICAAAVLYEPAFAVVAQWFRRRRSTALAIITFAAGLASTIFLPLSDALLRGFGWRTAILILGLFLATVTIPLHAVMLRRRPADLGLERDGALLSTSPSTKPMTGIALKAALSGRIFWLLTLAFGLISLSAAAIRVHFIPFLIDAGFDSSTAAFATGTIGIMQVIGRIVFAPLDQRFSTRIIAIGVFGLQALALSFLLVGHTSLLIGGFIFVFGAAQGAVTLARPSILAELYGISHYGRISSIMALFLTLTGTSAPLIASLLYDQADNYQPVLWLVVILAIAATGVIFVARRETAGTMQDTTNANLSILEQIS
ncbi:MAG: MFS transporter [Anaerolineaceae bacterium]|nr:MFS transporter [Anaerolineaceae bacterium]